MCAAIANPICLATPEVNLWTKYLMFRAIHINILLWGVESWAIHDNHIRKLQSWAKKAIRSIIGITMTRERESELSNITPES